MDILLDTCTFLWLTTNDASLSSQAKNVFADLDNRVYFSSASAWEIIVKHKLGKLPLPASPDLFIAEQLSAHQIKPMSLQLADVNKLYSLPDIHKDPFDRMLVCQALSRDLTILTNDNLISAYPVKTLW